MKTGFLCLAALLAALPASPGEREPGVRGTSYDLVIRNGRIVDGTGSPWYTGDVGIRDGRIAAIGHLGYLGMRRPAAPSTRPARWSLPASSTCSASPS